MRRAFWRAAILLTIFEIAFVALMLELSK